VPSIERLRQKRKGELRPLESIILESDHAQATHESDASSLALRGESRLRRERGAKLPYAWGGPPLDSLQRGGARAAPLY
jgi:hypothetical protein